MGETLILNGLSTRESIIGFIYFYNCYGLPTGENIKHFAREFYSKMDKFGSISGALISSITNLWTEILKNLSEYRIENKASYRYGYKFYEYLYNNKSTIYKSISNGKTEEEKKEIFERILSNIKPTDLGFEVAKLSSKDAEIIYDWTDSTMYKEGQRLIGIATGNPNENLWYAYNSLTNELKPLRGTEHSPVLEGKSWDEYVQMQQDSIVSYLDSNNIKHLELTDDIGLIGGEEGLHVEAEILTGYDILNNKITDKQVNHTPQLAKTEKTEKTEKTLGNSSKKAEKNGNTTVLNWLSKMNDEKTEEEIKETPKSQMLSNSDLIKTVAPSVLPIQEEEEEMYKLDFCINKSLMRIDERGDKYIECVLKSSNYNAIAHLYENNKMLVIKGSTIHYGLSTDSVVYNIREKYRKYLDGNIINENILCNSPSEASRLISGASSSGWVYWKDTVGNCIDVYKVVEGKKVVVRKYESTTSETDISKYVESVTPGKLKRLPEKIEINNYDLGIKIEFNKTTNIFHILDKNNHTLDDEYTQLIKLIYDIFLELNSGTDFNKSITKILQSLVYETSLGKNNLYNLFVIKEIK